MTEADKRKAILVEMNQLDEIINRLRNFEGHFLLPNDDQQRDVSSKLASAILILLPVRDHFDEEQRKLFSSIKRNRRRK